MLNRSHDFQLCGVTLCEVAFPTSLAKLTNTQRSARHHTLIKSFLQRFFECGKPADNGFDYYNNYFFKPRKPRFVNVGDFSSSPFFFFFDDYISSLAVQYTYSIHNIETASMNLGHHAESITKLVSYLYQPPQYCTVILMVNAATKNFSIPRSLALVLENM